MVGTTWYKGWGSPGLVRLAQSQTTSLTHASSLAQDLTIRTDVNYSAMAAS